MNESNQERRGPNKIPSGPGGMTGHSGHVQHMTYAEDSGDCERSHGPMRESSQTMLKGKIQELEHRLAGLKALLAMLGEEVATPQEVAVWEMLNGGFRRM
jgi:hypothetical protein